MVDRTKLRAFGNQGTCRFTFRFRSPIRGRDCQGSFFRRPTILSAHSTGRARSGTQPPRVPSRSDTMMEATRRKERPTPRCPHISWNSTVRWATNVTGSSYTCPERPCGQRRYLREQSRVQKIRDCFWRLGLQPITASFLRNRRYPAQFVEEVEDEDDLVAGPVGRSRYSSVLSVPSLLSLSRAQNQDQGGRWTCYGHRGTHIRVKSLEDSN